MDAVASSLSARAQLHVCVRAVLTVKMSDQQVPLRPHDPPVLWNMVTEVKRPQETRTINPLPLNERIFCSFNISQGLFQAWFIFNEQIQDSESDVTQHRAVFLHPAAGGAGRNTQDPLHVPDPSTGKTHMNESVLCLSVSFKLSQYSTGRETMRSTFRVSLYPPLAGHTSSPVARPHLSV